MGSRRSKGKSKRKARQAGRVKQGLGGRNAQRRATDAEGKRSGLRPVPRAGELAEDLAVFTKSCREQLSSEFQAEAKVVSESLELLHEGDFELALDRLKIISRGSPYSDWRLLIRGLVAFYNRDVEAARQNWLRLDRSRRPARIAATLLLAETQVPLDEQMARPPQELVTTAEEIFVRRGAVAAARQIAAVKHRDSRTAFSASQAAMLAELCERYREYDGAFVNRFAQGCVRLACFQPEERIFERLKRTVPGPPHDPHWNLLGFMYFMQFSDAEEDVKHCAASYVLTDLLKITHLTQSLKDALTSVVYVTQAGWKLHSAEDSYNPFSFLFSTPDFDSVEKLLREAIRKYPANRKAHELLLHMLQMQLEVRGLTESAAAGIEKQMLEAKEQLVQHFPDEVKTTLWLIDHYLETGRFQEADALIRQLADQRLDDPSVKALPWKLKLLESMRLSRKKADVAAARVALEAAKNLWPAWLDRSWLPFLQAALELRAGDQALFDQLIEAARRTCGANELLADVMSFAALQQMRVPGKKIKPLRDAIEGHVNRAGDLPLNDLCQLGSFFWDLCRTDLQFTGYRLQASKFGKVLCARLARSRLDDLNETLAEACSWIAAHRFWQSGYAHSVPDWFPPVAGRMPKAAATWIEMLLDEQYFQRRWLDLRPQITLLTEAARTERDPFYRHRFDTLAKEAAAQVAEYEASQRSPGPFGSFAEWDDDDEDDDDDYDDDDELDGWDSDDDSEFEDVPCNCPRCRARRARQASARPKAAERPKAAGANPARTLFDLDTPEDDLETPGENGPRSDEDPLTDVGRLSDEDSWSDGDSWSDEDVEDDELEEDVPPIVAKVLSRLGPGGAMELQRLLEQAEKQSKSPAGQAAFAEAIRQLFVRAGLSPGEALAFLDACAQGPERDDFAPGGSPRRRQPPRPSMTAEERRAIDKQRKRQLKQKKQKRR